VHREDRLRLRGDALGDISGVEIQRGRIDVGKNGRRTAAGDGLRRRVEGEGRADDLVPGPDAEGVEDEDEPFATPTALDAPR
jgi:hypothetical protein